MEKVDMKQFSLNEIQKLIDSVPELKGMDANQAQLLLKRLDEHSTEPVSHASLEGIKFFWVGEPTEIYSGKTPEEIAEYFDPALMMESINKGDFGEVDSSVVIKNDNGEEKTLAQCWQEFPYKPIQQIGSGYQ